MSEIKFESILEEVMYPEIKKIAESLEFEFFYQFSFYEEDDCDWFTNKLSDGVSEYELSNWAHDHNVPTTYDYEVYRTDFVLKGHNLKIAIELDGKAFHNEEADMLKDNFLKNRGFLIWRIKSDEILGPKTRAKTIKKLTNQLEQLESVRIWKTQKEKKRAISFWKQRYLK